MPTFDLMTRRIHFRVGRVILCGVGRRWMSQTITSTRSSPRVTCRSCRRFRMSALLKNTMRLGIAWSSYEEATMRKRQNTRAKALRRIDALLRVKARLWGISA